MVRYAGEERIGMQYPTRRSINGHNASRYDDTIKGLCHQFTNNS